MPTIELFAERTEFGERLRGLFTKLKEDEKYKDFHSFLRSDDLKDFLRQARVKQEFAPPRYIYSYTKQGGVFFDTHTFSGSVGAWLWINHERTFNALKSIKNVFRR